jgi:ketosteroid isomerase-like protein
MSQQKDLLREIAAATSSGAPDRISDWFTEDFRLHEPGRPALPVGHEGARQMRALGRRSKPRSPINVEALDMIEEGDRVAVRWQITGTDDDGKPFERSIMSIYRFENGRIAEDWGMAIPTGWPARSSEQAHRTKLDVVSSTNAPNPGGVG